MLRFIFPFLFAVPCQAGQIAIAGRYIGLNDTDPAVTLADGEAQDLLNVEVSKDGNSITKRSGYSLVDTLSISSYPIHGSILFRNSDGNNIEVYATDQGVFRSSNSGAYTQFITTATVASKWSFCAGSGIVYAFNDQHDIPFSYNGTTVVRYNDSAVMPRASLCAMTPTRMLLAGTTDQPNRLYFSEEGDYTNFTLGTEPSDPSFDDIGMAGDKITGLWANAGEWLIWKTNSLISYQGTNQYDLVASVISNNVGLSDPQARVEHGGVVYFRGNDAKIWAYSGGMLADTTRKLDTFNKNQTKTGLFSKQYTSKSDFDYGSFTHTASTITNGAIEPWVGSLTDTIDSDFNSGSGSSITVQNDGFTMKSNYDTLGDFPNKGFEMGDRTNWAGNLSIGVNAACPIDKGMYGDRCLKLVGGTTNVLRIRLIGDGSIVYTVLGDNTLKTYTVNLSTFTQSIFAIQISIPPLSYTWTSPNFYKPTSITFRNYWELSGGEGHNYVDFPNSVDITSATFISQTLNTSTTKTKYCYFTSTRTTPETTDGGGSPSYTYALQYIQNSFDAVNWGLRVNTSDYLSNSTTNQYIRYQVDLQDIGNYVKPEVSAFTITCVATGSWTSPEHYIGTIESWGIFRATETTSDISHWTYQISTSATAGGTGSTWYTIANSSAIGIPKAPYIKVRTNNSFTSSTSTVRVDEISYSYSVLSSNLAQGFEYLGDIFFTVPSSGSITNNRVMKYDTQAQGWTIFDIPMNAPLVSGNNIHFGSPTSGNIYTYPSGGNDAGAAINSYWESRDYMGDNVYVTRNFDKLSLFFDSDYASDVDVTYNIEPSTSISYNVTLTQTDGSLYIRNNRQLPTGTNGSIFNLKVANNAADKPWRFYGSIIDYTDDGWVAYP